MVDMDLDCGDAEEGWFELKSFLTNAGDGWESDINQAGYCTGSSGGGAPYSSKNHLAKCGFSNLFEYSGNSCEVDTLPSYTEKL